MTENRIWTRFVIVLGIAFVLLAVAVGLIYLQQRSDEGSTCKIQARGLPANKALSDVIGDLHFLVARPLTAQARHQLSLLPAKEREQLLQVYDDLNSKSATYHMLEGGQPSTRKC